MTAIDAKRKNSLVSKGVHTFKITKSEEKIGKESKEPYWNFVLTCQDKGPDEGVGLFLMISLSAAARFKVDQFLDAIGAPAEGSLDHPQCVGKTLRAEVKWDEYQGNLKAVAAVLIPFGAEYTPKPETTAPVSTTAGFEVGTKKPSVPEMAGTETKAPF
jgi:hypothetical protein